MNIDDKQELATTTIDAFHAEIPDFLSSLDGMVGAVGTWFSDVQEFDRPNFAGDLMLVVTELAEACEADRKPGPDNHCPSLDGRTAELADTLIRILHMAHKYKIDLGLGFVTKMGFNFSRPLKHGKAY